MIYEQIGKKIQKAREEAGLSQNQLATNVRLTQAALSNYELGKRRPSLGNLERIATSLGKPISYFLEESKAVERKGEEHLDESIREMIDLWYGMSEDERQYLLDFFDGDETLPGATAGNELHRRSGIDAGLFAAE